MRIDNSCQCQIINKCRYTIMAAKSTNSKCPIWKEIEKKFNRERQELKEYVKQKTKNKIHEQFEHHPTIYYLNRRIFPVLNQALIGMLEKIRDEESYFRPKSSFNGLDFLSEFLFNMNPKYPLRQSNWTYIFDMKWVIDYLEKNPRPYYPFSLLWSKEHAALKIQSFMRGYWVRQRSDVKEMRQFWIDYKLSQESKTMVDKEQILT